MLDINKVILNPLHYSSDPEGNLSDLPHWSPQLANSMAADDGLVLNDAHWEIIMFLRDRYRQHGNEDPARSIMHDLEAHFCSRHGRSLLFELFPRGPVSQASRLAGLPQPPHVRDPSFGSVM